MKDKNKGMWNQIPQTKEYIFPLNRSKWIEFPEEYYLRTRREIREVMELNMVMYGKW